MMWFNGVIGAHILLRKMGESYVLFTRFFLWLIQHANVMFGATLHVDGAATRRMFALAPERRQVNYNMRG